jgi:hypothetical protein
MIQRIVAVGINKRTKGRLELYRCHEGHIQGFRLDQYLNGRLVSSRIFTQDQVKVSFKIKVREQRLSVVLHNKHLLWD